MENKNKIIAFIIVIVALFIGLSILGRPVENKNKNENVKTSNSLSASALKASETFYDFGTIRMKNGLASKTFQVSNLSEQDINLEKISTSCMCTAAYIIGQDGNKKGPFGMPGHGGNVPKANETIKAGETRDIEVVYDPNAHGPAGVGRIERSVFLEDENNKIIEFKFKANVTP